MTGIGAFLSFGAICGVFCSTATAMYFLHREERAERARQAEVDVKYAPTLDRVRPAIDIANHLRPAVDVVRRHRALLGGVGRAAAARLWASVSRPAAPAQVVARPRTNFAELDTNSRDWPVNTAPASVPRAVEPVGRVHMPLDFDVWVNVTRTELRRHTAALAADPDATCYLPKVTADGVAR